MCGDEKSFFFAKDFFRPKAEKNLELKMRWNVEKARRRREKMGFWQLWRIPPLFREGSEIRGEFSITIPLICWQTAPVCSKIDGCPPTPHVRFGRSRVCCVPITPVWRCKHCPIALGHLGGDGNAICGVIGAQHTHDLPNLKWGSGGAPFNFATNRSTLHHTASFFRKVKPTS